MTLFSILVTAPESADQQLLDIDGTLFVSLGLFVVLALVLSRWLWKPYLRVRDERITRVHGYKDEALRLEAEARQRLDKVTADLALARREGSQDQAKARAEAHAREQMIVAEAQAQAQRALAEARAELEAAMTREKATLAVRAKSLGTHAAERILGRPVVP